MAKNNKADMSCARVKKYTASDVSKAERHNERKNETYENMNVIEERIPFNVHFKTPTAPTYMEQLKQMETDGLVSLRGLRKDATIFNEIVIDVNTMYFERNGGYEYAKQFYEEAFHFIEEKFGAENVISAVMHADEINIAATEELGKEVYHYHLHAMVLPVVEKEILWSKRCKDEKLRGTVKEVVHQISHSKKWKSDIPLTDEKGNPLLRKNGKPMFRASYSILQDELFNHMTEQGFKGFQRGESPKLQITLKHTRSHTFEPGSDPFGNITRMDNVLEGMRDNLEQHQTVLGNLLQQMEDAKVEVKRPFPQEAELAEKSERLAALNVALNIGGKDKPNSRERQKHDGKTSIKRLLRRMGVESAASAAPKKDKEMEVAI